MSGQEDANLVVDEEVSKQAVEHLRALLGEYPQYPAVALLRCWELALFSQLDFEGPTLDLGCGDGRIAERLLGTGVGRSREPVFGLDIDAGSVAQAAQRSIYAGVVRADARAMPLPDACLQSVFSICVLEHIPQVDKVLSEVARVLRPGAMFAFSVPTPRLETVGAEVHPRHAEEYLAAQRQRLEHVNLWPLDRWEEALWRQGLVVRRVHGFMPEAAARAWWAAYDWTVRPIRGRGVLYRAAGPELRRFGLGRLLAGYWYRRLARWAGEGLQASPEHAGALLIVAQRP